MPALARVRHLRGVVVVAGDSREVAVADRAVRLVREVARARPAVVFGRGPGPLGRGGGRLGFRRGRARRDGLGRGGLRPVPAEHLVDVRALAHREQHLVHVRARGIHLRLADAPVLDAHPVQGRLHRRPEVISPARVRAAGRSGHRRQRQADVLGPGLVDVGRHPAQPVEVVPGQDVVAGDTPPPDLVGHQVRHHDLTQVAEVDRAGRADAGGDDYLLARRPPLRLRDDLVGQPRDPVGVRALRRQVSHVLSKERAGLV